MGSLKNAGRLEDFVWDETSGVDHPANEEEGWLVMKSRDLPSPTMREQASSIEACLRMAYSLDDLDVDVLSLEAREASDVLRAELSYQGFTPEVVKSVRTEKGLFDLIPGMSKILDLLPDGKGGKSSRRSPYCECDKPAGPNMRTMPAVPRKRQRRNQDPLGGIHPRKPGRRKSASYLSSVHKDAILDALQDYGLDYDPYVLDTLDGKINKSSVIDLSDYLDVEGVEPEIADNIAKLLRKAASK